MPGSYAASIANIGAAKSRILWVGDSLLESQGASAWDKRLPHLLIDRQRTRYSLTEKGGVPMHRFYNGQGASASWATLGTVSDPAQVVQDHDYSLSKRGMKVASGNYWIAPTPNHDFRYVEVWYTEHTGLGQFGGFDIVDLAGPSTLMTVDNTSVDAGPKRAIYDYGSLGSRSVGVNPKFGYAYIDAVVFHQTHPDTGSGFANADSTCSGIASNAMGDNSVPWMGWPQAGADLVIDDLWHNDAIAASATPDLCASRFLARVGRYRATRPDIDILLVMMWNVPSVDPTVDLGLGYSFNDYRSAMLAVAASAGVAVFNLHALLPDPPSEWFDDGTHCNDTGYTEIANRLDAALEATFMDPSSGLLEARLRAFARRVAQAISGKADTDHEHEFGDIPGLNTALSVRMPTVMATSGGWPARLAVPTIFNSIGFPGHPEPPGPRVNGDIWLED